jgi:hypothetical protein
MDKHDVSGVNLAVPRSDGSAVEADGPENNMRDATCSSGLQCSLIP